MKKIGELMKEIGFNPNGSDAVKEAFIKNLIKNAYGADVQTPTEKKIISENPEKFASFAKSEKRKIVEKIPAQLAFEFEEDKTENHKKKSAV